MATLRIEIPESIEQELQAQQPDFLDRKGFVCLLLHRALTEGAKLSAYHVGAGNVGSSSPFPRKSPTKAQSESGPDLDLANKVQDLPLETDSTKEINKGINSKKPRAKRTQGTPEFEHFWGLYQSAPLKANKQAKPQAWEVWQQLVPNEISADELNRAIQAANADISDRQDRGEFASPLPDCFRWLRDDCYSVYLESHTPAQTDGVWR